MSFKCLTETTPENSAEYLKYFSEQTQPEKLTKRMFVYIYISSCQDLSLIITRMAGWQDTFHSQSVVKLKDPE